MTVERFRCGAIFNRNGALKMIDADEREANAWRLFLGWPNKEEIEDAKKRGFRFARVHVEEIKP